MKCFVESCKNNTDNRKSGISYHIFPKNPISRQKWLEAIGMVGCELKYNSVICAEHFLPEDLFPLSRITKLAKDAIPQIKLEKDTRKSSQNQNATQAGTETSLLTVRKGSSKSKPKPKSKRRKNKSQLNKPDPTYSKCEVCGRNIAGEEIEEFAYETEINHKLKSCRDCLNNLQNLQPRDIEETVRINFPQCNFCQNFFKVTRQHNPSNWHADIKKLFSPSLMAQTNILICLYCESHINQLSSRIWTVCRVCGRPSDNLIRMLESESFWKKFSLLRNVEVTSGIGLPNYICFTCNQELDIIARFHEKITKTSELLREVHNWSLISFGNLISANCNIQARKKLSKENENQKTRSSTKVSDIKIIRSPSERIRSKASNSPKASSTKNTFELLETNSAMDSNVKSITMPSCFVKDELKSYETSSPRICHSCSDLPPKKRRFSSVTEQPTTVDEHTVVILHSDDDDIETLFSIPCSAPETFLNDEDALNLANNAIGVEVSPAKESIAGEYTVFTI